MSVPTVRMCMLDTRVIVGPDGLSRLSLGLLDGSEPRPAAAGD